ncbi:hypothetical protein PF006_g7676 [Phytophthora fragariae]|nr:hypothetical protein PF006_g7676 [Phytophthora fragariae]
MSEFYKGLTGSQRQTKRTSVYLWRKNKDKLEELCKTTATSQLRKVRLRGMATTLTRDTEGSAQGDQQPLGQAVLASSTPAHTASQTCKRPHHQTTHPTRPTTTGPPPLASCPRARPIRASAHAAWSRRKDLKCLPLVPANDAPRRLAGVRNSRPDTAPASTRRKSDANEQRDIKTSTAVRLELTRVTPIDIESIEVVLLQIGRVVERLDNLGLLDKEVGEVAEDQDYVDRVVNSIVYADV